MKKDWYFFWALVGFGIGLIAGMTWGLGKGRELGVLQAELAAMRAVR